MYNFGYSPFIDNDVTPKNIFHITHEDLLLLRINGIEEGLNIEFKRNFDDHVKTKIPNIIASFANGNGGWLFIGVMDATKELNYIPKLDYELMISNILKSKVSPIPRYEVRFIENPKDSDCGILVVWVPEGDSPPYISTGKVYIRTGSDTSKCREVEDRYLLDKLYEKSEKNKNRFLNFCKREICIDNYSASLISRKELGMCNIYIIPEYNLLLYKDNTDDLANFIVNRSQKSFDYRSPDIAVSVNIPFYSYSYSPRSIIFRNHNLLDYYNKTIGYEQYYNGAAKIHIPINYILLKQVQDFLVQNIKNIDNQKILEDFSYFDGGGLMAAIFGCLLEYLTLMKELHTSIKKARIMIKMENIRKHVALFDNMVFKDMLIKNGMRFSDQNECFLNDKFELTIQELDSYIVFYVLQAMTQFGYGFGDCFTLFLNMNVKEGILYKQ